MKTITVQIGNSDDHLSQKEWSEFVIWIDSEIRQRAAKIFFFGTAIPVSPYQNACWVFDIDISLQDYTVLKIMLKNVKEYYHQNSVAFTVGDTIFLK